MLPKSINIASRNKNTGRSLISFSFLSIICAASRLIDSIRTDTSKPPARKQSQFQHALYFVLHDASAVAPHHILQDHAHESSIVISFFSKLMYRNLFVNRPLAHFLTCPSRHLYHDHKPHPILDLLYIDVAVHFGHDVFADVEAEAIAGLVVGVGAAPEAFEDVDAFEGRDGRAGIGDGYEEAVVFAGEGKADLAAVAVFDGVFDQVLEDVEEAFEIAFEEEVRVVVDLEIGVDKGEFFFVGRGEAADQVGEIVFAVGDFDVDDVFGLGLDNFGDEFLDLAGVVGDGEGCLAALRVVGVEVVGEGFGV